jgi:lipopolysaccharide/colanic/teichoic acid biosynthesis glycosyltransferase
MKRLLDVLLSAVGLVLMSPVLIATMIAVWLQDFHSPFYVAPRVGRGDRDFRMVKLRSMIVNADASGVDSTSSSDARITSVGRFIRKFKLDELMQLWNVLTGDMSLVGPRPNVRRETELYTDAERKLLTVRPGITDFASIVFSDEGDILKDKDDPDLAYNQLIRPWKSRLALISLEHSSLWLDFKIVWLTAIAIISRERALAGVGNELSRLGADSEIRRVATRAEPLKPHPPPGSDSIVETRVTRSENK